MDPRPSGQGPLPAHTGGRDAGRSLPATPAPPRILLRVVLALWLAALLLGSLGELFGLGALIEITDYRAIFLR